MDKERFVEILKLSVNEVLGVFSRLGLELLDWIGQNDTELVGVSIILFLSYALGILIASLIKRGILRSGRPGTLAFFFGSVVRIVVFIFGIVLALYVLNLQQSTTSLLAGVGILGVAIGFALQDVARDLVAGLFIILKQPFADGDLIRGGGYYGQVIHTDIRSTRLRTLEGQVVTIPNKDLFSLSVENFSRLKRRRLDLEVGVAYSSDLESIRETLKDALESVEHRLLTEDVQVYAKTFAASSIVFQIQIWLEKTAEPKFLESRHQAVIKIKEVFDQKGITIPYPISAIDYYQQGSDKVLAK